MSKLDKQKIFCSVLFSFECWHDPAPSSVHFFVLAHQLAHRSKIRQMALHSFSDVGHFFIKTIKQRAFDETFFHYPWA